MSYDKVYKNTFFCATFCRWARSGTKWAPLPENSTNTFYGFDYVGILIIRIFELFFSILILSFQLHIRTRFQALKYRQIFDNFNENFEKFSDDFVIIRIYRFQNTIFQVSAILYFIFRLSLLLKKDLYVEIIQFIVISF